MQPSLTAINIHAASPQAPGGDPHHFAIYDKVKEYGATLHYMTKKAVGVSDEVYSQWINVRNQLVHGRGLASREQLKEGVLFLCEIIKSLAAWGQKSSRSATMV